MNFIRNNLFNENFGKILCQINSLSGNMHILLSCYIKKIFSFFLLFNILLSDGNFEIINPYFSNKLKEIDKKSLERLWIVLEEDKERVCLNIIFNKDFSSYLIKIRF